MPLATKSQEQSRFEVARVNIANLSEMELGKPRPCAPGIRQDGPSCKAITDQHHAHVARAR